MCDRDNYRLLGHLSRVVDEGVNSVHREFNAETSGFFRAPRVSRPFQHFLPFNCFNIPKRSFILSAGVDRISLTCFDRRIPWLTKPPGCFCFLDSFVCLSKLVALFFSPFGLFFFSVQVFLPTGRVYDSILCRAFDVQKRGGDGFLYGNCV